jgi:F-type H+-transporting ATPase subunit b
MADETTPEHPAGAAGSTEVPHESGGGGLPQFRFEYWGGQIVFLLIIFAVLYILLAKVFVPRFRRIQDNRATTIADAVSQARSVQAEAEAQAAAAKAEIEDARAKTRGMAADAKAKDARLQAQIDEAEARIRGVRDKAMSNVRGIAADTAGVMVEKLTGKKAAAAEITAATKGAA